MVHLTFFRSRCSQRWRVWFLLTWHRWRDGQNGKMNEKIVLEGKDTLDRLYEGGFSNKFHYFRCLSKMSSNFCSDRSLKDFVYMAIAPFVLVLLLNSSNWIVFKAFFCAIPIPQTSVVNLLFRTKNLLEFLLWWIIGIERALLIS